MDEREQFLNHLIEAARSGSADALEELSSIAFGGNHVAQKAIHEIDELSLQSAHGLQKGVVKSIVWPKEVEEGKRGPKLGDIPLHNDV
jgi:hypothetical protein